MLLRRLLAAYQRAMDTHPMRTQIVTSTGLWFAGDVLAQKVEGNKKIDWTRTRGMTLVGLALAGPVYSVWYPMLDRITAPLAGNVVRHIAAKVALDQLVFEPPFLASLFITSKLFEGGSLDDGIRTIKSDYVSTYLVDCTIWPAVQVANFRFVPVQYQALVVNAVCVGWNTFLSYVTHRTDATSTTGTEKEKEEGKEIEKIKIK